MQIFRGKRDRKEFVIKPNARDFSVRVATKAPRCSLIVMKYKNTKSKKYKYAAAERRTNENSARCLRKCPSAAGNVKSLWG